jgi:hypothetical protein
MGQADQNMMKVESERDPESHSGTGPGMFANGMGFDAGEEHLRWMKVESVRDPESHSGMEHGEGTKAAHNDVGQRPSL